MGLLRALMAGELSGESSGVWPDVWAQAKQRIGQPCLRMGRWVIASVCMISLFLGAAAPAYAQDNSVDYTLTNQSGADFSGQICRARRSRRQMCGMLILPEPI